MTNFANFSILFVGILSSLQFFIPLFGKKIDKKDDDENQDESSDEESVTNNENTDFSKTVFEKFTDKIKNFLENAE